MQFASFFSALLFAVVNVAPPPSAAISLGAAEGGGATLDWNADLDTLQREVPKLHANAFHTTTKASFDAALKAIAPFAWGDNDGMRRLIAADLLAIPEMLHAAGIAPSADRVAVDGVTLNAIPFGAEVPWLAKSDARPFWFEQRGKVVYF